MLVQFDSLPKIGEVQEVDVTVRAPDPVFVAKRGSHQTILRQVVVRFVGARLGMRNSE
jgi:hypothetical protein